MTDMSDIIDFSTDDWELWQACREWAKALNAVSELMLEIRRSDKILDPVSPIVEKLAVAAETRDNANAKLLRAAGDWNQARAKD